VSAAPKASAGLTAAIDYGPFAVFFVANLVAPGDPVRRVLIATGAFMAATLAAIVVSRVKLGRVSPVLWVSGMLVIVFGGLTLWFRDSTFLKVKPTIVYLGFAAVLGYGLATRKPLLQQLFGTVYPGLNGEGWRKLTRNWLLFFVAMAAANEAVWRWTAPLPNSDLTAWAAYKLWVVGPATLVFALVNIPMLMRHGLMLEAKAADEVPPQG